MNTIVKTSTTVSDGKQCLIIKKQACHFKSQGREIEGITNGEDKWPAITSKQLIKLFLQGDTHDKRESFSKQRNTINLIDTVLLQPHLLFTYEYTRHKSRPSSDSSSGLVVVVVRILVQF